MKGDTAPASDSLCRGATCRRTRTEVSAMVSVAGRLADRSGKDGKGPLDDLYGYLY
jgi:hypothetical protein